MSDERPDFSLCVLLYIKRDDRSVGGAVSNPLALLNPSHFAQTDILSERKMGHSPRARHTMHARMWIEPGPAPSASHH